MTDPAIRPATPADIPAIHALVEGAYRGDGARAGWSHEADLLAGQRTDPAALAATIADPARRLLLAGDADGLSGCVRISRKDAMIAALGLLSVAPARQAGGLGRALIDAAERAAITLFAARAMELTVIRERATLIAYYQRRGYAPTGEVRPFPMDDPRFGVPLRRDLAFVVLAKTLAWA